VERPLRRLFRLGASPGRDVSISVEPRINVERFLKQGHKVKVTIMFRGREMAHTELGRRLLERLATDLVEIAQVDSPARQDGRNMITVFSPRKTQGGAKGQAPVRTP
jgi:translation initiation factor IF-3